MTLHERRWGAGGVISGGLFLMKRVKRHSDVIYWIKSQQIGVRNRQLKLKRECLVLYKMSLRADLRPSQSTVGGGSPQLTSQ